MLRRFAWIVFMSALLWGSVALEMDAQSKPPVQAAEADYGQTLLHQLALSALPTASQEVVLDDSKRGKKIYVRFTYPTEGGPYPVIVFSHGAGGSRDGYEYLAKYWAEHGYVCLQPSHVDSIALNRELGVRFSFVKTIRSLPSDRHSWLERVRDVSFLIDSLPKLSEEPALKGKMITAEVGVGGHSFGAFTSQLIGGASVPSVAADSTDPKVADQRVRCILAISPQGVRPNEGSLGFESPDSFRGLKLPAMFLTGDRDQSVWNGSNQRADAFRNSPAGDKYFVSINGANHMTFAGMKKEASSNAYGQMLWERAIDSKMPASYGDEADHLNLTVVLTTLFWNAYLKGDVQTRTYLQSHGFKTLIGKRGLAEHK